MSKILHLVRRELLVQKGQRIAVIPVLLGASAAVMLPNSPAFAVATVIMAVYFMAVYVNAYDFKYNAELGYRSLPVRRSTLVVSRYVTVLVLTAAVLAISVLVSLILNRTGLLSVSYGWTGPLLCLSLFGSMLYFALFFPLYFQLGYMKSRWANYFAMLIVYALLGTLQEFLPAAEEPTALVMTEMLKSPMLLVGLLGGITVFTLSMAVSIKIYSKKEVSISS